MKETDTLEDVPCNLCTSAGATPVMNKHGYTVRKCGECGLVFVSPRISSGRLARDVYGPGYFNAERGYGIEDHLGERARKEAMRSARARLRRLERFVSPGRLLDVGCAGGWFLAAARERGWDAEGVEISEFAASHARDKLGFRVRIGDFSSLAPEPDSFDLVTMQDAIEHLPDPMRGLRNACETLKPGGILFVAAPNFSSAAARALGCNWGLVEPEHHLFYFTPATLGAMLEKTGFKIEKWEFPLFGLNDLLFSAGALQRAGIPVTDGNKSFIRKNLRPLRDGIRAVISAADKAIAAPLFARDKGVIMEVVARKI